jgi:hypothetical protein
MTDYPRLFSGLWASVLTPDYFLVFRPTAEDQLKKLQYCTIKSRQFYLARGQEIRGLGLILSHVAAYVLFYKQWMGYAGPSDPRMPGYAYVFGL